MKTLLAELKSARVTMLDIHNAFDLRLYQNPSGDYEIVVCMKLQFFFENNHPHQWDEIEENIFIMEWEQNIHEIWGNKILKTYPDGGKLSLHFEFTIQKGGWMFDHWEITVLKIGKGDFNMSYVLPILNNVKLDSEDLTTRGTQRAAVHEFGHMIGLRDEYNSAEHIHDYFSIMHNGEKVRDRHVFHFIDWADKHIIASEELVT